MKVAIAGYTGLVGQECLQLLCDDLSINEIIAIGRNKPSVENVKIKFIQSGLDNIPEMEADAIICCLGTTIKKAGTKEAFEKVDRLYVINFQKAFKSAPVMAVVSAVGADSHSGVFYNKVKGLMEQDLKQSTVNSLYILHPSILLGKRKEFRLGERIGIAIMQLIKIFFAGPLYKFKPIHANQVARALINSIKAGKRGTHILEGKTLFDMSEAN